MNIREKNVVNDKKKLRKMMFCSNLLIRISDDDKYISQLINLNFYKTNIFYLIESYWFYCSHFYQWHRFSDKWYFFIIFLWVKF